MVAGLPELEARLEGHVLERCTDRLALHFQRSRRQPSRALRVRPAKLECADDRAVAIDAPNGLRPIKTADGKQLADDKAMGPFKAHLLGRHLDRYGDANQQNRPTRQHPSPITMRINVLFTITFTVELLGELRTWLTIQAAARRRHVESGLCYLLKPPSNEQFSGPS